MTTVTNKTGISLALAVWLVNDDYDYQSIPNYISVTSLMKPLRQTVLRYRLPVEERPQEDVEDFISRAMGNAVHDSIEKAWTRNYKRNLQRLGYPMAVIERILINPTEEDLKANPKAIPVYVEQRAMKKVKVRGQEWIVGGKFDMVSEGIVQDFKTTSAFVWVNGGRDDEHQLQGSLYRWLNPDKIHEDFIRINYLFTDWAKFQAKSNPKYPQQRVEFKDIPLLDITTTEDWVNKKLEQIIHFTKLPEDQIPLCTDEELWMSDPKYKYYAKPETATNGGRSTKNFDNLAEAKAFMISKGGVGIVVTEKGQPKRCEYCDVFGICKQKDSFEIYQQ